MTDLDAVRNSFNKIDIGIIFNTKQIKNLVNIKYGKKLGNIIPSDYCYNITNNGINNYKNYLHIFINHGRGIYEYVGENYNYTGIVTNKGTCVGEWIDGVYSSNSRNKTSSAISINTTNEEEKSIEESKGKINSKYSEKSPIKVNSSSNRKEETIINSICRYLLDKKITFDDLSHLENIKARAEGRVFSFTENIKALIYAQLSNQTKWNKIVPKLGEIDKLFFEYDKEKILNTPSEHFYEGIFKLKCGNIATKKQILSLKDNIHILEKIEREYGSLDKFYKSFPVAKVARMLSIGKYKQGYIGFPLALEFLRNIGIDAPKPDVHIRRILGRDRLGYSNSENAGEMESVQIINDISEKTGYTMAFIDAVLWSYCANGYGQVCTKHPKCDICVISEYCNNNSKM